MVIMPQFDTASTKRLYAAIRNNDVNEFQAIHDAGYPIATATFGERRETALMMAVNRENIQLASVKKLMQLGSRLDAVDSDNSTPLHIATSNPDNDPNTQAKIIAYLVRKGANLEALDNDGYKPVLCAMRNEKTALGELFSSIIIEADAYMLHMKKHIRATAHPNDHERLFDEAAERDDLYEREIAKVRIEQAKATTGRGFADKETQRRAEQTTGNPMMASLVANEGGFAGAVRQQQEEKKKESCCVIM